MEYNTRKPRLTRHDPAMWVVLILVAALMTGAISAGGASAEGAVVPLKPALDVSSTQSQAVSSGTTSASGLWQSIDDGTTFASTDNDTTRVETMPGNSGTHTVGYAGAPAGTVTQVVANVRARRAKFVSGTVRVLLFDGTTLLGTGGPHGLGTSYANFSDTFTNLSVVDANNLRTEVQLQTSSTRGTMMYTQLWLEATYTTAPTTTTPTTTTPTTTTPTTTTPTTTTPTTTTPTTTTPPSTGTSDLLGRRDFIYGSEIGAWRTTGKPATDVSTAIPNLVKAAKVPVVRFSVYDVFSDMADPLGNPGTQSRANFDAALNSIKANLNAEPMIKLLPITTDLIGTKNGSIYCPPLNNLARNLDYYKALVAQAGPRVRIYESTNEMEYACSKTWGFASAGSVGVSKALGQHFAQNMPALKKYARSLGIDIVTVGYIGTPGGFGWGDSIANPRVSTANEFLTATHDAYVASGYDPDYIPDVISIHAYPNSPDFGANPSLNDIIAYHEAWQTKVKGLMSSIWGTTIGSNMKMAISEWNAGSKDWTGFNDSRVVEFYSAWLAMLKRDGYWLANQFALASNGSEPYDMITETGATRPFYATFTAASTATP